MILFGVRATAEVISRSEINQKKHRYEKVTFNHRRRRNRRGRRFG